MVWSLGTGLLLGLAQGADDAPVPVSRQLELGWQAYLDRFVQRDGRVVDPKAGGVTTSEGQAYALLRAVWMDDTRHFRRVLRWTRKNLQGGDPAALPAWRWGVSQDGSWGVLDPQPASDADQWMAWSLLLAAQRWGHDRHHRQALGLLDNIWQREVLELDSGPVILPGPWAADEAILRLNPSYFLPFAWRTFAAVDPGHGWDRLLDMSYHLLQASMDPDLLPPDWLYLDRQDPTPQAPPQGAQDHNRFGFEAFRLGWTLAAEQRWYREPRATPLLQNLAHPLERWADNGSVPAVMEPDGTAAVDYEYSGLYGAMLPAWDSVRPELALEVYQQEILPRWAGDGWEDVDDYYSQNWIWFGLALWSGLAQPPEAQP